MPNMKRLLTILCIPALLLLGSTEGWSLPPCEGSHYRNWTHCVGTYTHSDGAKYSGGWKDGKPYGQGTFIWADGAKHVGGWKNGKRHGVGTVIFPDGTVILKGMWRNGELLE